MFLNVFVPKAGLGRGLEGFGKGADEGGEAEEEVSGLVGAPRELVAVGTAADAKDKLVWCPLEAGIISHLGGRPSNGTWMVKLPLPYCGAGSRKFSSQKKATRC